MKAAVTMKTFGTRKGISLLGLAAALVVLALLAVPALLGRWAVPASGRAAVPPAPPKAPASGNAAAANPAASKPSAPAPLALVVNPGKTTVGAEVRVSATGLPANKSVDLVWKTAQGGWVLQDYYHFQGKKYTETTRSLGKATVGSDGHLDARFTIPEDYGGVHDVLVMSGGTPLAQGGVEVVQTFEMSPTTGPVGTVIEIRAKGLGWRTMESTWVVNWDNVEVGWVSAASSHGTAVARFRATGPAGDHLIKVYSGYMGQSYLNYAQAPTAYLPRPEFTFHTTAGGSVKPAYAEPYPPQVLPPPDTQTAGKLSISPVQGPVATQATLRAEGLPANASLALVWETWVGSRVKQSGFAPEEKSLGQVKTDAQGRLETALPIPDDLGGRHELDLKSGDTVVARTYFVIETSIVSISPTSGPAGTEVTIHLKGVGWTEYDNILVVNYDNAYMGYVCGFNSQGDVKMHFAASGAPGVHLIDFYPGIYQGPAEGQQLYRLPQLTYADDHPGNKIPALRFAFEITK